MRGCVSLVAISAFVACCSLAAAPAAQADESQEVDYLIVLEEEGLTSEEQMAIFSQLDTLGLELVRDLHGRLEGQGTLWKTPPGEPATGYICVVEAVENVREAIIPVDKSPFVPYLAIYGKINILTLIFVRNHLNLNVNSGDNWMADVNGDGIINVLDLIWVRNHMNRSWDSWYPCHNSQGNPICCQDIRITFDSEQRAEAAADLAALGLAYQSTRPDSVETWTFLAEEYTPDEAIAAAGAVAGVLSAEPIMVLAGWGDASYGAKN